MVPFRRCSPQPNNGTGTTSSVHSSFDAAAVVYNAEFYAADAGLTCLPRGVLLLQVKVVVYECLVGMPS